MAFPPYTPDHMTGSSATTFTSIAEIERILSYKGRSLHLDDLSMADDNYQQGTHPDAITPNYMNEVIQRVTSKVMEYLAPRFQPEVLETLPRIREIATYWACHDITRRRGNEPLYEEEYADAIETLERYREGSLFLNAPSAGPRAILQSYTVDNRYAYNAIRVISTASSSTVTGQTRLRQYPFAWL